MQVAENNPIKAYYFAPEDNLLPHGDGRPVSVGAIHHVPAPLELCAHGLHASEHPMDALKYADSCNLYRVDCWGEVEEGDDKLCAEYRRYSAHVDATQVLRKFACLCALDVLPTDAPAIVRKYLQTQDESLRTDAYYAAYSAVLYAVLYAARDAAYSAVLYAARDAAYYAAYDAACDAARSAAYSAACSAAKQRKRLSAMLRRAFANAQK